MPTESAPPVQWPADDFCMPAPVDHSSAIKPRRSYAGVVGLPGTRVLSVNEDSNAVGQFVSLSSGARLKVKLDGTWLYTPPAAIVNLPPQQKALDSFTVLLLTDGREVRTVISVSLLNHSEVAEPMIDVVSPDQRLKGSDEIRVLVTANSAAKTEFNFAALLDHAPGFAPGVVVIRQPQHGRLTVLDGGQLRFEPAGGFVGNVTARCLIEGADGSGVQVEAFIDIRPPVEFHVSDCSE